MHIYIYIYIYICIYIYIYANEFFFQDHFISVMTRFPCLVCVSVFMIVCACAHARVSALSI